MMNHNLKTTLAALLVSTASVSVASADTIRFWTTEEQPERLAKQEELAAQFKEASGHDVEIIPVTESELGTRATAAFAADDLPDVIYHTLQYTLPWAEAGILDVATADEIVEELGRDTFAPGVIDMASMDGEIASVPVDGWTQMVVYRKDLFEENGLEAPNSFANIEAALDALSNPPEMYGFVAPTKVDENFMSQVLEHVFLANDVSPVGEGGFAELDETKMTEILEFYKKLVDASPEGELYWKQARELYFDGKAAMIIWSPFILDELAGLRDAAPVTINDDPTTRDLAADTGVVTTLAGPSNDAGAAWADIRFFGITNDANTDVASEFVKFSMNDGYTQTLAIAPEGKFPVRRGTAEEPTKFVDEWAMLEVGVDRKAPLSELYDEGTIQTIVDGLETAKRWGVEENQLSLASKINNSQAVNRIVREFVDGEIDAAAAVARMNEELAAVQ